MRITRQRDLKVNLGSYESLGFGSSVTLGHGDVGYTDDEARALCETEEGTKQLALEISDAVLAILNDQLVDEIEDARELTTEDKSFIVASFTEQRRRPRNKRR